MRLEIIKRPLTTSLKRTKNERIIGNYCLENNTLYDEQSKNLKIPFLFLLQTIILRFVATLNAHQLRARTFPAAYPCQKCTKNPR